MASDVAADREDEVHPLAFVEVFAKRRPGGVGQFVFVVKFVDGAQHGAVELVGGLAALDARDVVVGEPSSGPC